MKIRPMKLYEIVDAPAEARKITSVSQDSPTPRRPRQSKRLMELPRLFGVGASPRRLPAAARTRFVIAGRKGGSPVITETLASAVAFGSAIASP
jgi:hypothetical protein